ncbi:metallo-beta-lactamase protein [Mariniradius saccharolyticus AK6]|uniref:Metallo-beta-lactamase protein n=1 Tax=Mariniradius saccharolyticus AK6 TaxID=1239962 RepID=M7X287_9BACT|nr:MBL fold metallo-hydrolase [Mariniradius saccharolyticus]EMS31620.1 metallo-beta-lactamase protein [Mariniradius saccharolyticus AK6]
MADIRILDLRFQGASEAIASFLVETDAGPVLIETGPDSTFANLEKELAKFGYLPEDIKHVLLTHIHFDHAGAAWRLAKGGAKIFVHPAGAVHLVNPERLWNSASQNYGDDMEKLWGQSGSIPSDQVIEVEDEAVLDIGNCRFKAIHTPGHAVHHIAWKLGESIFTGDIAGVKIENGPVVPPCPPPDIHIEAWKSSLGKIKAEKPSFLFLTHFGIIENVDWHLDSLSYILDDWSEWMKSRFDQGVPQADAVTDFISYTRHFLAAQGCSEALIEVYEKANPSFMSVAGLYRYWKLKQEGRLR